MRRIVRKSSEKSMSLKVKGVLVCPLHWHVMLPPADLDPMVFSFEGLFSTEEGDGYMKFTYDRDDNE